MLYNFCTLSMVDLISSTNYDTQLIDKPFQGVEISEMNGEESSQNQEKLVKKLPL